jgi:predicted RNase H-like HicB family nuclease
METYIVIIDQTNTPSDNLYGAFVPDVPGCTAMGKNLDDVLYQIKLTIVH